MRHEIITANEACSAGMRAQLLINGHIAQIDAALRMLKAAKDRLLPSIYAMHREPLTRMRRQLARDLDSIMAAPLSADIVARRWNSNAYGPNVLNACEAVDYSISRAAETMAYRDMIVARRAAEVRA